MEPPDGGEMSYEQEHEPTKGSKLICLSTCCSSQGSAFFLCSALCVRAARRRKRGLVDTNCCLAFSISAVIPSSSELAAADRCRRFPRKAHTCDLRSKSRSSSVWAISVGGRMRFELVLHFKLI